MVSVRCLSVHARYRCRHSGACCSGVFAIPAEARVVDLVGTLGLQAPPGSRSRFVSGPESAGSTFVAARPDGACVFFEAETGRLCTIHRRAGAGALPSSCRHFPRVFLHDARGIRLVPGVSLFA